MRSTASAEAATQCHVAVLVPDEKKITAHDTFAALHQVTHRDTWLAQRKAKGQKQVQCYRWKIALTCDLCAWYVCAVEEGLLCMEDPWLKTRAVNPQVCLLLGPTDVSEFLMHHRWLVGACSRAPGWHNGKRRARSKCNATDGKVNKTSDLHYSRAIYVRGMCVLLKTIEGLLCMEDPSLKTRAVNPQIRLLLLGTTDVSDLLMAPPAAGRCV